MKDLIARNRWNTDFENRSLFLLDCGGGIVSLQMSIAPFVTYLNAVPRIAQRSWDWARAATAIQDAATLKHLITLSSAVVDVAGRVRDEVFSDNRPSFATEPYSLNITGNDSISDNRTNTELADQ